MVDGKGIVIVLAQRFTAIVAGLLGLASASVDAHATFATQQAADFAKRATALRQRLEDLDRRQVEPPPSENGALGRQTQWFNFPNFPNWSNWANAWNNWANRYR